MFGPKSGPRASFGTTFTFPAKPSNSLCWSYSNIVWGLTRFPGRILDGNLRVNLSLTVPVSWSRLGPATALGLLLPPRLGMGGRTTLVKAGPYRFSSLGGHIKIGWCRAGLITLAFILIGVFKRDPPGTCQFAAAYFS